MKIVLKAFILCFLLQSCYQESYVPAVAKFTTAFKNADESVPVYIVLTNLSERAETYLWEFEGGTPEQTTQKNPDEILYTQPGTYKIKLTVTNIDGETDSYEQSVVIKDAISINFTKEIIDSTYPPVTVKFTNLTQGEGLTYKWTFDGGQPSESTTFNPPAVVFPNPGAHVVTLAVFNGFETETKTDTIYVRDNIRTDFAWETAPTDYDYQAPVKLFLNNLSENAISYQWEFPGGTANSTTIAQPEVTYSQPGTYTITLHASNGKKVQSLQKQVTIQANTGIYVLENVKLGVNYAHNSNTIGAFYSTKLRRSFTANEITSEIAPYIDLVYQGQSNAFTYNKFISPTQVAQYGFAPIPNATDTWFINSQDICNCGLDFTEADFDAMTTEAPLQNLNIPYSIAGQQQFNNQLPRIVLFKTQDGRKGAIKIKQFVSTALNESYLICDIKVQKQP
ncbi:PKD domain-containing protein [Flavobacterium agricola]|uniref:PKD domain-containing protein n=1 Tax=Flavobacterium agricola TaxID=2870839 RepID=A0ABY6M052_9FLAO|nr:PKD domain-containing protein [Flavobacterium agricola]UYW01816.1 PKD domain-containing protein [Flavobacterium agricola]